MTLIDGGSKENWAERLRSRTYWIVYVVIPIITILNVIQSYHEHNGQGWKWFLAGIAFLAFMIWRRPKTQ